MIFTIPSMLWLELTALHLELKNILTQVLVIGNLWLVGLGKDYYIDGQNTRLSWFKKKCPPGEGSKDPKSHPVGRFFGPWSFIILKNSHQDLSNEGSNFILSSLEVGHWAAQTQPFFDKFPEMIDFGLLQQSWNRAKFWLC